MARRSNDEPAISRRVALGAALAALTQAVAAETPPPRLRFEELYKSIGVLGIQFSDRALGLRGQTVALRGYMAPPLKAESDFFVLTREPMAVCPFCQSDADWPADIVVVYLRGQATPTDFNQRIEVGGTLEIGSWTDPRTGFVSAVRLVRAQFDRR